MGLSRSDDPHHVFLPAECVVEHAAGFREDLVDAVADPEVTHLDVSRVRRLDLTGIQLIYSALRQSRRKTAPLALAGSFDESAALMIRLSGYDRYLPGLHPGGEAHHD